MPSEQSIAPAQATPAGQAVPNAHAMPRAQNAPREQIAYRNLRNYKYELAQDYQLQIPIRPPKNVVTEFVELNREGDLLVRRGYAWDGPSGPTIDTPSFMRGSLVHDALYQLMRMGLLGEAACRPVADGLLRDICLEDGMASWRAWYVYRAVRLFAAPNARPAANAGDPEAAVVKAP